MKLMAIEYILLLILIFYPSHSLLQQTNSNNGLDNQNEKYLSNTEYESLTYNITEAIKSHPDYKSLKKTLQWVYIQKGLELKSKGEKEQAISVLEKAGELDTINPSAHSLLAMLYFEKGDLLSARKETQIALLSKPQNPYLTKLLAKINYLLDDYNSSIKGYYTLKSKHNIQPENIEIEKIKEEKYIYNNYKKLQSHPFIIYYPDSSYKEIAGLVSQSLVSAYLNLSEKWGFKAQCDISVYLYPQSEFNRIPNSGNLKINGLYDGKIRVLINSADKSGIQKTAVHELTHHILSCLTNANIPFWLNEGLAQYIACQWSKPQSEAFYTAVQENKMIPFNKLDAVNVSFYDTASVKTAYLQSYCAVSFLIENYGDGIILNLINGLKKGHDPESVLQEVTLSSYKEFSAEITRYFLEKQSPKPELNI